MFLTSRVLLFSLSLVVSASSQLYTRAFGVTSDAATANGLVFDYIIVGSGQTGTTVAARLSEDPSSTVLVVEAGNDDRTNPNITDIYNYGNTVGTSMEWRWVTDLDRGIRGGRTLGGSSSVNGGYWTRGQRGQYDAFSRLLSEEDADMDWNFDSLFAYMKKAESFNPPDDIARAKGADYVPDYHGFSGPIHATFAAEMYGGLQQSACVSAVRNVTGIDHCPDIGGGEANCVVFTAHSLNPSANYSRSSAAAGYLTPVEQERTNWLTLVNHRVTKLVLEGDAPNVKAAGIQFKRSDNTGDTFTASARKEVIMAAGTFGTPQLLQVSGIGDPAVLNPLGIDVKVSIPTVGRNLQEKATNFIAHAVQPSFDPGSRGPGNCLAFPSLREIFGAGSNGSVTADDVVAHILASYPSWARDQAHNALNAEALEAIFAIQADVIINNNAPVAELLFDARSSAMVALVLLQMPFSRGNVTITDADIFTPPEVFVNWLNVDFDLELQTAGARATRKILNDPAFSGISAGEASPGIDTIPDDGNGGTDSDWQSWIWQNFRAVSHPVGTAAMMRRDWGGVVDGKLRVYDTLNLRIVDASILPIELSAHLQSSLYGVAEKAADIIKSGL